MAEISKLKSVTSAIQDIQDGATIMVGGFGGVGSPPSLIQALLNQKTSGLTIICNDAGFPDIGVGRLVTAGRVKRLVASHIGSNPGAGTMMEQGRMIIEFSPQGTLAERIRAGGVGLGGILVDIGMNNEHVTRNKKVITSGSKVYLLEEPLTADYSLIYAQKGDSFGNLTYDKTARNMNPLMAMAADRTIAEICEYQELGSIEEEAIITPGVFVTSVVKSSGVNWKWAWEDI
ncbi:3-oxoacid CoA-transferase subunit A [Bacillus lacus]|uniref:3-oxoacid CoA-transferase subunit A n=1 Tax=Metabacillus lacus TaxID=1983721 RepID=A0A7X2M099_9BACI|nr:CoA transferase subunit A [Metabacillus lacus]MRX72877.1 3-oxoacid CoA-transferase subunit A [Metabacillus lacus]